MTEFIPIYNLDSLNEQQRQDYVRTLCKHIGVPSELNLVILGYRDEGDGHRRLVAIAKRGAAEIIRSNRNINVTDLKHEMVNGSIVFTATGRDGTGRQEMAAGSKYIKDLVGRDLDDGIMTAQTRACRRMAIQFVGAGILDESEVNSVTTNIASVSTPLSELALSPQPSVKLNNESGKDVTIVHPGFSSTVVPAEVLPVIFTSPAAGELAGKTPEEEHAIWVENQNKLRDEAIAKLNASAEPPVKTRKPRGPNKPKINLGPSEPVIQPAIFAPQMTVTPAISTTPEIPKAAIQAVISEPAVQVAVPNSGTSVPITGTKRLTPEQVKPFRQRLFRLQNEHLEPAGFAPKEGMGNADKMRMLAGILFSEVASLNELTPEQWEKYLSLLEQKVQKEGAVATIKYIEETIGV